MNPEDLRILMDNMDNSTEPAPTVSHSGATTLYTSTSSLPAAESCQTLPAGPPSSLPFFPAPCPSTQALQGEPSPPSQLAFTGPSSPQPGPSSCCQASLGGPPALKNASLTSNSNGTEQVPPPAPTPQKKVASQPLSASAGRRPSLTVQTIDGGTSMTGELQPPKVSKTAKVLHLSFFLFLVLKFKDS